MARMQPNGWKMPSVVKSPPSGGRGGGHSSNTRRHFPRVEVMQPTAVIHALERTKEKEEEVNAYLNPLPPPGLELFETQYIIAGKHLIPLGLDRPEVLDGIRIKNKTWISYDGDCVLDIASDHPLRLKQTCQDLYSLIRDLRLTSERPTQRFIVQRPSPWLNNVGGARISLVAGLRPAVVQANETTKTCIVPVSDDLVPKMAPHITPLAVALTGLDKDLLMSVSFGRLNLQKKKKSVGDQVSYANLPGIMKPYVTRGGATLGSKLPLHDDTNFPELLAVRETLRALTNASTGIRPGMKDVSIQHTLIINLQGDPGTDSLREIRADMSKRYLGVSRMRVVETFPRLDWTVLAPDRQYDWKLRVNAREAKTAVPQDFASLLSKATTESLANQEGRYFKVRTIKFGEMNGSLERCLDEQIKDVQIKTSAKIHFARDPYIVEVSVTQTRPGLRMTKPDISWGIDFYGSQWKECLNDVSPDGLRKDWGRGLANVWPNCNNEARGVGGSGASKGKDDLEAFEKRFGYFLSCVLKTQAALEGLEIEELSDALI